MAIFIISALAFLFCVLTIIFCRYYIKKEFDSLDGVLDKVLAKDASLLSETTRENRLSKFTCKAHHIIDMYTSEVAQTKEEKDKIQSFISDMSHQMKTPLTSISLYVSFLLDTHLSPEEEVEFLCRIKSSSEKLQWMMDSLIKMARLEIGAIKLTPSNEKIKKTISLAISSVIASSTKKNISISIADFNDISLYHDKKWTGEALVNVLENAIKYSDINTEIKLTVEPMSLYTKITVTNSGKGIEKKDWHLIFKRFYRGENAKDEEGAGLGLYLASLIMEKQGGYIMVDSIPCVYTSFFLFLQNCKN